MSLLVRRLSATLALLALTLCFPQGSLTLCANKSGRLALEATCDASALPAHAERHPAAAEHCGSDGGCGPCQDAQVGTELSAGRIRDFGGTTTLLALPTPVPAGFEAALPPAPRRVRRSTLAIPPDPFARVQAGESLRI